MQGFGLKLNKAISIAKIKFKNNKKNQIMKNLFLGMLLLMVTLSTQAQVKKNKNAKYTVEVNGNCEQCQKRIQKAAFSVPGVKMASWNLDSHQLTVTLNEEKSSISEVKKAIAKVGHDTDEAKATQDIYAKLPDCCQYDRQEAKK